MDIVRNLSDSRRKPFRCRWQGPSRLNPRSTGFKHYDPTQSCRGAKSGEARWGRMQEGASGIGALETNVAESILPAFFDVQSQGVPPSPSISVEKTCIHLLR